MACAQCGAELPAGLRFCVRCGAPQDAVCAQCGSALLPDARFCGSCGSAVAAGQPAAAPATAQAPIGAERRLCSVLFADLVGFTPLSATRDPEDVRELLSRYFDIARKIVARHGGVVEKFIGDAVMAVWGTPIATEEDAERAVRAGLELVDAVGALGIDTGIDGLAARAGVVTGEVAVTLGAVGEGMVAGDAVNTAARVQAAAESGAVFVDSATRRLTAAAISYADEGEHTLKGKAEPEQLWRVTRVVAAVGGAQRVDGLEARLIGRDSELRLVKEMFHAAADRRTPRLLVVAGAPGIGKSRIGWEFEKYIDGLAIVVNWHRGRCLSYGEGIAFWALAEAVRQRLTIAEDDPTAVAIEKLTAALPAIVPDADERSYVAVRLGRLLGLSVPGDTDEVLGRDELFAGWRIFFERLAATSPVVLLIEDGQHADTGLLDFFDHLVDWARELPIFLLVLTRPELEERRAGFGVGRNRTALTLDPLDRHSMTALVEALVPGIPTQARDAITDHAQGVPLFAVETVRSLVDRDIVQPIDGVYRLVHDVGELSVPNSLHALLAARLDALPAEVRALVADAAVLGASFPAEAVIAVSDQSEQAVRSGLAELLRREVLEISADPLSPQRGEYRFAQDLLRQVAYDTLSRRDRKSRHLAVAAHLRATFADDGEEVSDAIARHYRDALQAAPDDPDADELRREAVRMWVRAAERANRAGAPGTAGALYAKTAELAEDGGDPTAAGWWEQAAGAARIADDVEACVQRGDRAHELFMAAGRERDAARVLALTGASLSTRGQLTRARERLEAALAVLRSDPDVDTVTALLYLGQLQNTSGVVGPNNHLAQAIELGQALDVGDVLLAEIFATDGVAFAMQDRPAQGAASLEFAARLAARAGDRGAEGKALANLSDILAPVDPRAAAEAARTAVDRSRQVGARRMLAFAVSNLAEALLTLGDWDEAAATLRDAEERDGLDGNDITHVTYARLFALRGDVDATRRMLAGELDRFRASEDPQDRSAICMLEALLAAAEGDHARALERAQAGAGYDRELGINAEAVRWCWAVAARSAYSVGDTAAQQWLLDGLDQHPIGKLPLVLRAERDLIRARVTAATDEAAATALFDRAIEAYRKIPALFHLAHALLDRAELLTATGDPVAAELGVAEAAQIAHRLGARPLAERAAAAQARTTVG